MALEFSAEDIAGFKADALDALATVESELLALEKMDPKTVESTFVTAHAVIFRAFHNLKGASGMFRMTALQNHMHRLETQFQECAGLKVVSGHITGYFLAGVDAARDMLDGESVAFDYEAYMAKRSVQKTRTAETAAPPPVVPGIESTAVKHNMPRLVAGAPNEFAVSLLEKLKWRDTYATGKTELDFPHQFLLAQFSLAAELFGRREVERTELAVVMAELVGIMRLHFAIEDFAMENSSATPEIISRHRAAHEGASTRLREYETDLAKGEVLPSKAILAGLANDFLRHLREEALFFRLEIPA